MLMYDRSKAYVQRSDVEVVDYEILGPDSRTDSRTGVPGFAHIAGVRVGVDTLRSLERKLGPGQIVTGGHPGGARQWRIRGKNWLVYACGFYYAGQPQDRSAYIDDLRISADLARYEASHSPKADLSDRKLSLLGRIHLGMPRAEVLTALNNRSVRPTFENDTVSFEEPGYAVIHSDRCFRSWRADLRFRHGRLADIEVVCTEEPVRN